jgi:hypothetical protein
LLFRRHCRIAVAVTDAATISVSDTWAYRTDASSSRFHKAVVLAIGTKRPAKVRVELVADEWQGEQRWVPPSRLEVRWDERGEYIAADTKLRAVHAARPYRDDLRCVETILWKTVPMDLVEFNMDISGSSKLLDIPGAARFLDIEEEVLRAEPNFQEPDGLVVPWTTTATIARAAANRYPNPVARYIEEIESRNADDMKEGAGPQHGSPTSPDGSLQRRYRRYSRPAYYPNSTAFAIRSAQRALRT